ncbi:MAG: hypothetical protein ACFFCQ_05325 [Promethearchaeota archaeon]
MVPTIKSRFSPFFLIILGFTLIDGFFYTDISIFAQSPENRENMLTPYQTRAINRFLHIIQSLTIVDSEKNQILIGTDALTSADSRSLESIAQESVTLNLDSLRTRIKAIITLLSEFNETSYQLVQQGALNFWYNPSFISNPSFNRTTFNNNFQIFSISYLAWSYNHLGNSTFEQFVDDYSLEEQIDFLKFKMVNRKIPVEFLEYLFPMDNIRERVQSAIRILNWVLTEFNSHEKLKITFQIKRNIQITLSMNHQGIALLSDPDSSVKEVLSFLKKNQSMDNQPFSGDEILILSHMGIREEVVQGIVNVSTDWRYEDNSLASEMMKYVKILAQSGYRGSELFYQFGRNLALLQIFALLNDTAYEGFYQSTTPFFDVQQIRINSLDLSRSKSGRIKVESSDLDIFEHHWLGMFLYNDTNHNGLMDIEILSLGSERPVFSNEILYRLDGITAENISFTEPQYRQGDITFSFSCNNFSGMLTPFAVSPEVANFNRSLIPLEQISNLAIEFSFSLAELDQTTKLKFDFKIGEWNNTDVLSGLSLNQLFSSVYTRTEKESGIMKDGFGNKIDYNSSTILGTQEFTYHEDPGILARFELSLVPYLWNNSEELTTYGQQIPLLFVDITQSEATATGQNMQEIRQVSKNVFLSSINYPSWDGLPITHDPTFEMTFGEGKIVEWVEETAKILLRPASLILAVTITLLFGLIITNKKQKRNIS